MSATFFINYFEYTCVYIPAAIFNWFICPLQVKYKPYDEVAKLGVVTNIYY
jgi:hypothetical protein